ncbi:MAG: hypothetical protein KA155_02185 [Alphaproteobacteria bacterium]|jgi:tetratricopeptide (TPR) repeat protein|nr:hypothetical protein [Alphaproteobacteria bacterium]
MPLYEVFDTSARRRKEIREIKTVRDFLQICIDQCEEKNYRNRAAFYDLGVALERYRADQAKGLLALDSYLNTWGSSVSPEIQDIKNSIIGLKGNLQALDTLRAVYTKYMRSESDLKIARGDMSAATGNPYDAMDYYNQARKQDPSNARALTAYARELMIGKQFSEAGVYFSQVTRLDPEDPRSRLALGVCRLEAGYINDAINIFNTIVQIRPQFPTTYLLLAEIYKKRGHSKEADMCYMQAAEFAFRGDELLDPEETKLVLDMAMAHLPRKPLMLPAPQSGPGADASGTGPEPRY